jgi:hypothetical protein
MTNLSGLDSTLKVHPRPSDETEFECYCGNLQRWPEATRKNVTPPFISNGKWVSMQLKACGCGVMFAKFFPAQTAENIFQED